MQDSVFWTDDCPRPADLPVTDAPSSVDVAVIGSGYTGLNAAMALAEHGARVAVLEAETIGWGASSRNGGMMTTGLKEDMPVIAKRVGLETARQFWAWALASIDHVAQTVADEGIDCAFGRPGHLYLAYKPAHFEHMREAVAWYADNLDYHDMHALGPDELAPEIGSRAYHGAIVDTRAGAVHPARYVFGLAQAAARRGVSLVEHARVTQIQRTERGFRLVTPRGLVNATEVLVATNGYTGDVVPAVRNGVFPVGSYIITTAPLDPALQAELSPRGRMFFDSKNFLNYFRLTPDGRMLFGGRHNLSPNLDVHASARMMRARMVEVFPQLADVPLSHTWRGRLGLTFDLMPHVGRLKDGPHQGVWYAYGFAGHGVSVASYLGAEVGKVIAGAAEPSVMAATRQPRYFFTKYDRVYLPLVSSWFRLLDRVA